MLGQNVQEGTVPFQIAGTSSVCHTWFKIAGEIENAVPLIMIHGGPGAGHSDLWTLAPSLARDGVPVICYDQIGCGNSSLVREKANDADFWSFDLFCAELDNLVDHFRLRERGFFVHGHSWGGMLASTYAARRPRGLRRLIIACSPASAALYASEAERLFRALPTVNDAVLRMDADGRFDAPEYKEACAAFVERYFSLRPCPEVLEESGRCFEGCTMFDSKWGRSRIRMVGSLKDYDATKTASNINVPTLLVTGGHDYMTEAVMQPWSQSIALVEWVVFESASHMVHLEEPERYFELLKDFLLCGPDSTL